MTDPKIDPNETISPPMKMEIYCSGKLHREIFFHTPPINGSLNVEFTEYLKQFDLNL